MERMARFEDAVVRLLDSLAEGSSFASEDLDLILTSLTRYLRVAASGLTRDEAAEVIDAALVGFLETARAGKVDRDRRPGGYLITIARSRAVDLLSSPRRWEAPLEEALEDTPAGDDPAGLLQQALEGERVIELIRRNREAGRHELNAMIGVWLNLAERGERPTLRALSAQLGIAPSTVRARMDQLATLLAEEG